MSGPKRKEQSISRKGSRPEARGDGPGGVGEAMPAAVHGLGKRTPTKISVWEKEKLNVGWSSAGGAGRKPVKIDLEQLERLCALQCTDAEIAHGFTSRF